MENGKKLEKKIVIVLMLLTVIIISICFGIYYNFITPRKINVENIVNGDGKVTCEIEYMGNLSQQTTLVSLDNSDKATKLEMVEGNGVVTDFLEISGYAYMKEKNVELFRTSVILKNEDKETIRIKTVANTDPTLAEESDGKYDYAYFRSIVPVQKLNKNEKYRIYVLYGEDDIEYLKDTKKSIMIKEDASVEVFDEN